MTRAQGGLQVTYTVKNDSPARVWVADKLLQNTPSGRVMKAVDQLIVRNGAEPDIVSFVRGMTYESMTTGRERPAPSPAMLPLAPGEELHGQASVPLPLTAWHNYGVVKPLAGEKRRAVLELTYLEDPAKPEAWRSVPLEDGTKVNAPDPYVLKDSAKTLTSEPQPLP